MTDQVSIDEVLRARMRSQGLAGAAARKVPDAVRKAAGLQAQSALPSRLAVRPRSAGLDLAAVVRACNDERSVVRTWAMRGTLHMVPADDVRWLVALLGPGMVARGRRRRLQLGLDDALCERSLPAIRKVLASGPLTRDELVRQLAGRRVRIDADGQAPAHLVGYAAARGVLCRGPDMDNDEPTYVLLDDWVPAGPEFAGDDDLAELARRYLAGFAPASLDDFASWSGLPMRAARRGFDAISDERVAVTLGGRELWFLAAAPIEPASAEPEPYVRLLAHFDTYLLGYRDRDAALPPKFAKRIQAGGGFIQPSVLVDGRVVGSWRHDRRKRGSTVTVEPFTRLDPDVLPLLEAEAADLGRFIGSETTLAVR